MVTHSPSAGSFVVVELTSHGYPDHDDRNDALADLAARFRLPVVATGERALPNAGPAPPRPSVGGGTGAPVPGRDGRLAPPGRHGTPALRGRDGRPVRRPPRRRCHGGAVGGGAQRRCSPPSRSAARADRRTHCTRSDSRPPSTRPSTR